MSATMDREESLQKAQGILTADDLLAKMRAGKKETYEIWLRQMMIPVRILSVDEINACRREGIRVATTTGGDEVDANLARQKATLKLASTLNPGTAPILADKVLSKMSVDEINHVYSEYVRVMDIVNPSLEAIEPEQFRALVDALKKNEISSNELSLRQLKAICTAYQDLIQRQVAQTPQPAS